MNRVQEVKKAFPEFASLAIETADPKHKNKYLMWIASQLAKKYSPEDIRSTISSFHKDSRRLRKSDIYSYPDLKVLDNEIKDLAMSKRQVEIFSKEMGAVKIFGDESCTLVRINSKTAMLYYGKASKWCIAMESEEYWEDYSSSGNVFYVLLDKENQRKYAIQKKGLMDVTIWEEDDDEVDDIDDWVKRNDKFESAVFACLHDREEPMLYRIKRGLTTRQEVSEWIKYQNQNTIKFLHNMTGVGYYLFDPASVTRKTIKLLSTLNIKYLEAISAEYPNFITDVANFLAANPKVVFKSFRFRLAHLLPDPDLILNEEDANFIKMNTDPSIASKLLTSKKQEVWSKALLVAKPSTIVSILPSVKRTQKREFIRRLKMRTDYAKLIEWLAATNLQIPNEVWLSKAKGQYGEYAEEDKCTEEDEECDEEEDSEVIVGVTGSQPMTDAFH
jgi:hypothetical protein